MKKAYVKPEVYFESFELSASIALACPKQNQVHAQDVCGVVVPGVGNVFLYGIQGCEWQEADGKHSVCYHNPDSTQSLFNSQ